MATWSYVNKATVLATGGTGGVTISVPSGVANGDLLVLVAVGFTAGALAKPAAFTAQSSAAGQVNPTSHKFFSATRIASSEPASYTVTSGGSAWWGLAIMYVVRSSTGISTITPAEATHSAGYITTLVAATLSPAAGDLTIYGYGGTNSAGSGGTGLSLPSPASLITGSSSGDINSSTGGTDYGIIACQTASPGSATITTGVDQVDFGLTVQAVAAAARGLGFFPCDT